MKRAMRWWIGGATRGCLFVLLLAVVASTGCSSTGVYEGGPDCGDPLGSGVCKDVQLCAAVPESFDPLLAGCAPGTECPLQIVWKGAVRLGYHSDVWYVSADRADVTDPDPASYPVDLISYEVTGGLVHPTAVELIGNNDAEQTLRELQFSVPDTDFHLTHIYGPPLPKVCARYIADPAPITRELERRDGGSLRLVPWIQWPLIYLLVISALVHLIERAAQRGRSLRTFGIILAILGLASATVALAYLGMACGMARGECDWLWPYLIVVLIIVAVPLMGTVRLFIVAHRRDHDPSTRSSMSNAQR